MDGEGNDGNSVESKRRSEVKMRKNLVSNDRLFRSSPALLFPAPVSSSSTRELQVPFGIHLAAVIISGPLKPPVMASVFYIADIMQRPIRIDAQKVCVAIMPEVGGQPSLEDEVCGEGIIDRPAGAQ